MAIAPRGPVANPGRSSRASLLRPSKPAPCFKGCISKMRKRRAGSLHPQCGPHHSRAVGVVRSIPGPAPPPPRLLTRMFWEGGAGPEVIHHPGISFYYYNLKTGSEISSAAKNGPRGDPHHSRKCGAADPRLVSFIFAASAFSARRTGSEWKMGEQ